MKERKSPDSHLWRDTGGGVVPRAPWLGVVEGRGCWVRWQKNSGEKGATATRTGSHGPRSWDEEAGLGVGGPEQGTTTWSHEQWTQASIIRCMADACELREAGLIIVDDGKIQESWRAEEKKVINCCREKKMGKLRRTEYVEENETCENG